MFHYSHPESAKATSAPILMVAPFRLRPQNAAHPEKARIPTAGTESAVDIRESLLEGFSQPTSSSFDNRPSIDWCGHRA